LFYIDWYTWPLLAFLAISEIVRGTRDLKPILCNKKKSETIGSRILLGYLELLTGLILLIPTLTDRKELAFLAFFGSIIALITTLVRFNPIQRHLDKFEALQGLAFVILSTTIIVTSIL
tara:strand:- start:174 stop:530 length:357 start_codon:yes stop_codon:yes gene_type:complete